MVDQRTERKNHNTPEVCCDENMDWTSSETYGRERTGLEHGLEAERAMRIEMERYETEGSKRSGGNGIGEE